MQVSSKAGSGALGALADWRTSYWGDDAGGTCLQVTGPCLLVSSSSNPGRSSVERGCGRSRKKDARLVARDSSRAAAGRAESWVDHM